MAISNYFPEQNDPNNPQSGSGVGGTSILGGGGGGASSPGAAAPSSAPTGSGFTNLQKYIGVSSDQGGQLANVVTNQAGQGTEAYTTGLSNIASGIAGQYGANTAQYGNTVGEQDSIVNDLNINAVDASGLAPAITTGANALNTRQDLALNSSDAQQSLLKKEFGQGYQSGFGKLDSLILGQTNRAGLEAGIAGNKANIAAAGVNAQGMVDTAKGSMDAAKGRYDQSVTANTAWRRQKAIDDAEAKRVTEAAAKKAREDASHVKIVDPRLGGGGGIAGTSPGVSIVPTAISTPTTSAPTHSRPPARRRGILGR